MKNVAAPSILFTILLGLGTYAHAAENPRLAGPHSGEAISSSSYTPGEEISSVSRPSNEDLSSIRSVSEEEIESERASCSTKQITVSGGEAAYTECSNSSGVRTVDGWVKDTKADGKCAQVYAYDDDGTRYESLSACPKDTQMQYHFKSHTSDFLVYLRAF